jgi:hypothetical protein
MRIRKQHLDPDPDFEPQNTAYCVTLIKPCKIFSLTPKYGSGSSNA